MKMLVILGSGIGNSILFGPALRALRSGLPDAQIDLLAYRPAFAEPFTGSDLINNYFYYEGAKTVFQLRKSKYDVSICAFPSNKWQFNLFAWCIGARRRITHSYETGKMSTLAFLQNQTVPADESLHDVEQNLNLLQPLEIPVPEDTRVTFHPGEDAEEEADEFLDAQALSGKRLLGVHPGAGPLQNKRAPVAKFMELIRKHNDNHAAVLIFGGPEEREIKESFAAQVGPVSTIVETSLKTTAALIRKCGLFITNDTGLMHIASTSPTTKVIALFNGTNPTRTSPRTDNAEVIVLRENTMTYPFKGTDAKVGK